MPRCVVRNIGTHVPSMRRLTSIIICEQHSVGITRKFYLIAPGLKKYKIERLAKTNVTYYDSVASYLFSELKESLNKNVKRDFSEKTLKVESG